MCSLFIDAKSSFVSPKGEAGSQYSFRYFCLIRRLLLDGAFNNSLFRLSLPSLLYMTFFSCQIMTFRISCSCKTIGITLSSMNVKSDNYTSRCRSVDLSYHRRHPCGAPVHTYIYIMIFLVEATGIWSGVFFVSASVWDSRNWNFWVKLLRCNAGFGGRLKRPSPCLIRSAPGQDRVCGLSETSEECANFCILGGIRSKYS